LSLVRQFGGTGVALSEGFPLGHLKRHRTGPVQALACGMGRGMRRGRVVAH
jgi:hypothetical protein